MRLLVIGTAALLLASPAAAQSREEPSLAFTISAGMTAGGRLWSVDNQPLAVVNSTDSDLVGLGRKLRPGLAASLAISYYRSPHWGLNGEVAFFGIGTEQSCRPPAVFQFDTDSTNKQGCASANGRHDASSAIAFMAGVTYRFLEQTKVQPYLRANVGLALLGSSFVQTLSYVRVSGCTSSSDNICVYPLLAERKRATASPVVSLAGGFAYYLGPGYRVRMEGRDLILSLPTVNRPTPISANGLAETTRVVKHIPVFMIGFDVLLERKHSRRY